MTVVIEPYIIPSYSLRRHRQIPQKCISYKLWFTRSASAGMGSPKIWISQERIMWMRVSAHYTARRMIFFYAGISQVKWTYVDSRHGTARKRHGTIVICNVIVCDNTFITFVYAYIIWSMCLTFYGRHFSSAHTSTDSTGQIACKHWVRRTLCIFSSGFRFGVPAQCRKMARLLAWSTQGDSNEILR